MAELLELIEEEITNSHSVHEIKQKFTERGYLEEDIDKVLDKLSELLHRKGMASNKKNISVFTWKELLDRIGYGFASHQFVNILFMLSGASVFLIGLFNGLKSLISVVMSSFLQEYTKVHDIGKKFISKTGIVYGFSFLFIAWAITIQNVWLFGLALVVGSLGVVTYGDVYQQLMDHSLKKEKRNHFLAKISYYGLLITAACLLISGWMIDYTGLDGRYFTFFGQEFKMFGYLNSFFITAVALILSGYTISYVRHKNEKSKEGFHKFFGEYFNTVSKNAKSVMKNKYVLLLIIANMLIASVQVLANSYYGIFIYQEFQNVWMGGFTNVAVVFSIALIVSFLGPSVTKHAQRHIGLSPMLVFGTLLMSLMPLAIAINPSLVAIIIANGISIIGASIVGTSNGLFARKVLSEENRKLYFSSVSFFSTLPFILLIPAGAWIAQTAGFSNFYYLLAGIMVAIVMPLFFVLVLLSERNNEKL